MGRSWNRRGVLRAGGSLLLGTLAAGPVRALPGPEDLRRLLGTALPEPLREAIPDELKLAGEVVDGVLALEREAKERALPLSPLGREEAPIPNDPAQLYRLAMPRLVALVDRGERADPGFAERAGGLLARLHATQHLLPERLVGLPKVPPLPLDPLGLAEGQAAVALPVPDLLPEPETGDDGPVTVSRSRLFADLAAEYAALFETARLRPEFAQETDWHLSQMRLAQPRYQALARRAGVPWQFIAAVHGLEASFNFRAHLHNGDYPLSQRTHQVPSGHPLRWLPPSDWESSALDALRVLGFTGQADWSLPRMLHRLEAYNGFGYRRMALATPYLWSFSNHYSRGKFVADGRYSARARSQQCGAAVMLKLLQLNGELDIAQG